MPDLEPIAQHYFCPAEARNCCPFRARNSGGGVFPLLDAQGELHQGYRRRLSVRWTNFK